MAKHLPHTASGIVPWLSDPRADGLHRMTWRGGGTGTRSFGCRCSPLVLRLSACSAPSRAPQPDRSRLADPCAPAPPSLLLVCLPTWSIDPRWGACKQVAVYTAVLIALRSVMEMLMLQSRNLQMLASLAISFSTVFMLLILLEASATVEGASESMYQSSVVARITYGTLDEVTRSISVSRPFFFATSAGLLAVVGVWRPHK